MSSADSSALRRALAGDAEAFGEFFDAHAARMLRYFQIRTADGAVAADLCAETFASALESLDRYEAGLGTPLRWLYGIARHKYQHWLDAAQVERQARERLRIQLRGEHCDELDLVELRADLAHLVGPLEEGLAKLSDGVRLAVQLRVVDELPYAKVAELLECSEGAARVRVSRGLDALLAHLGEVPDL